MELEMGSFLWFAKKDLNGAYMLKESNADLCLVCCQQSIEKALKAVIESKERKPRHTHNLSVLYYDTGMSEFNDKRFAFEFLTNVYISNSYPGMYVPPTQKEVVECLNLASDILEVCMEAVSTSDKSDITDIFSE